MKKIASITLLFFVTLGVGVYLRNHVDSEFEEREKEGHEQNGPTEFLKFHQAIRTRSDEAVPGYPLNYQMDELHKAKQRAIALRSGVTMQSIGNGVTAFTERGPGNVPGRTRGLIVDPDDATHKTWFAGSASGGIWKTIDGGTSWQWLTQYIPNMATACLAMAESDHNVIYAGTGEGFGLIDGVNGKGIFKSTDRGTTWTSLPNSVNQQSVNRIVVDPTNANIVLAATTTGLFRSIDGGDSWTNVYDDDVKDLKATPGNFSVLYGTVSGVGVIKSIDGGMTWDLSIIGMGATKRIEIAISPVKTNRLVASVEGSVSGTNSDLYFSDDGGNIWSLVTLKIGTKQVNYLGDQGWYGNTVAFSPYDKNVVYVGGIGAFQVTVGAANASSPTHIIREIKTGSFIYLVNFQASAYGGKLELGSAANQDSIQVRFGPGLTQKAHRFLVPNGATSGVPDANYTYQDYVDVPFQVWNKATNQQLMVSFRDQGRNGVFDLIKQNTSDANALLQSREYIFIHNVPYNPAGPNGSIAQTGGHTYQRMYFFWPTLTDSGTWNPNALPSSTLEIDYFVPSIYSSTVKSVADVYSDYDGINTSSFVHPDQHNILPIKQNDAAKTYQILLANDGGVFLSSISTSPGTTQGEWRKVGYGYNTSQFYGADKKPGAQEYFGGMQDNSTYFTPKGVVSSQSTYFITNSALAGDGFQVLWHSIDANKMIGSSQFNYFVRSLDGGSTWLPSYAGLTLSNGSPDNSKFPFISKLAHSKVMPDRIFTVGTEGVWRSTNFGTSWNLIPLSAGWGGKNFPDVEVSSANPNIVWAGPGQYAGGNLFVSTNGGATFNAVPNPVGFTLGNITRIATHPLNPTTAFALYSFAKTSKVLMTNDLGQTWTDISGFGTGTVSTNGFPDVAVYCLYVRPDNPNIIWAGTEIGIVESLDGGATWALLNEFPSVSVWDMKGQDNEIIIATHGRGIWTATVDTDQNGVAKIIDYGTSPKSEFKLVVNVPVVLDSVQITINSGKITFIPPGTGNYILKVSNVPKGNLTLQTVSYRSGIAKSTAKTSAVNLQLASYQEQYYDFFVNGNNFQSSGFSVLPFGNSNTSLQSTHSYPTNSKLTSTLLVPIIVSAGANTNVSFDDIAILQPASNGAVFGQPAFNDYVIAEATKDGLNWTALGNGYNSASQANWLAAFNSASTGNPAWSITETFDLKNKFAVHDTLLIRFRLYSNADNVTGWGWSIDNLYIQQEPMGIEPAPIAFAAYPNPSAGKFTIDYYLKHSSEVTLNVWDITGRKIINQSLGAQTEGKNSTELNLEGSAEGVYLVAVISNEEKRVLKVIVKK